MTKAPLFLISAVLACISARAWPPPVDLETAKPPICSQAMNAPIKNKTDCPFPPNRKNGKPCFSSAPTDLGRHTEGYKEYVLDRIAEAVEKTRVHNPSGVDMTVLMSVLSKESWYNPMSKNAWGDIGIAQFQPPTAQATLDYMRELGMEVPAEVNTQLPPGCQANSYDTPLSASCFDAIVQYCLTAPYSRSLFCPNFALELMAFHFLQIKARPVMVDHGGKSYNVALLLTPPQEFESEIRHLTSVYNRGFRIYNSAFQHFLKNKTWPTAHRYGALWSAPRAQPEDKDPFPGGTLLNHHINRCYVWAIGGLCGGMKTSVISQYKDQLCRRSNFLAENALRRPFALYRKGDLTGAFRALEEELSSSQDLPADTADKALDLALSLYEGESALSSARLNGLLALLENQKFESDALRGAIRSYRQALGEAKAPISPAEALRRLESLRASPFGKDRQVIGQRYASFRLLKAQAKRAWLKKSAERISPEWLYVAGTSGFYFHNSGSADLKNYIDRCAEDSSPACAYRAQALDLWKKSLALIPDKAAQEDAEKD